MIYLNRSQLGGTVTEIGEVKEFESGGMSCTITIQTTDTYIGRDGEPKKQSQWNKVCIGDEKTYESVREHLLVGNVFVAEGRLQSRSYDKNGQKNYVTEVLVRQFVGKIQYIGVDNEFNREMKDPTYYQKKAQATRSSPHAQAQIDDDVPF